MNVREYTDADFARVKEMYGRSGFDYQLPSLSGTDFFSRRVIGSGDGIGMAAFLRHTAEVYLITDPEWRTPAWRHTALRELHIASFADAREHGVKEIVGFVPPPIEKKFGSRLRRMGWNSYQGADWRCYSKEVR